MTDKKEIVNAINHAFTEGNFEGFLVHCTEDTEWTMVGETTKTGKTEIREWLKMGGDCEPPVFDVANLIEDGDIVVCSGDMTMKDGAGKEGRFAYCDIYRFNENKVAALTTFVISTDANAAPASA